MLSSAMFDVSQERGDCRHRKGRAIDGVTNSAHCTACPSCIDAFNDSIFANLKGHNTMRSFNRCHVFSTSFKAVMLLGIAYAPDQLHARQRGESDNLDDKRTVTVTGHGEVRRKPDMVEINLGVTTEADTAGKALDDNSKAMQELLDSLAKHDVEKRNIRTTNISVSPKYKQPQPRSREREIVGYTVTNQVHVRVMDHAKLGEILDDAVAAGGNRINGISFSVREKETALDEARKKAMADAQRKAELYASAAKQSLGNLLRIQEQVTSNPPNPLRRATFAADAAAGVPVEAGEQVLEARVQAVFELREKSSE
jgi:uncharacterized protein